ncbi:MAG: glycosyltransferase [Desulfobacteraceae bacterium]|nr:glycosyltransferase [Desulfobacteraceae bacterium]MBC2754907.1 glycosyltransferase [Desulfobacteraceae bacterium]
MLVKETQARESEVHLKQQEINNITSVAEQRLYIIKQFESAKEDLLAGFKVEIDALRDVIEEKQNRIQTLDTLIIDKDRLLEKTEEIAESRLLVIREQENAIHSLRKRRFKELIKLWLQPRLGVLYHYPPRPVKIPEKYYKEQKKSIPAGGLPLISIVTPSYNQAGFIERTIKSVFQQQYPKLEYLIQDGGSDDGTVDILKKYEDRLKRWESTKDEGQSDALNQCFSHAFGNVMAYLNSDDLLLPGALHYVAHYFAKHPDVDVVYGHRVLVDEYDQEIGRWVMPPHDDEILSWADYIPQETMFWRREIWEKAGGFIDKNFKFAMDWDLILRFREAGAKIVRLPRFLGAFRVHPHQKTSAEISDQGEKEMQRLRERCLGRMVSEAEINQNIKKYLSRHVFFQKLYRAGLFKY